MLDFLVVTEDAERLLRRHDLQVTAQRLAVLRAMSSHPHATADELTEAVIRALQGDRSIADIDQETNADMVDVAGKFRLDQGRRVVLPSARTGERPPPTTPTTCSGC